MGETWEIRISRVYEAKIGIRREGQKGEGKTYTRTPSCSKAQGLKRKK